MVETPNACGASNDSAGASTAATTPRIRNKRSANDGYQNMAEAPHIKREQRPHKIARGGLRTRPGHGGHGDHGAVTAESSDAGEDRVKGTPDSGAWTQPNKGTTSRQVRDRSSCHQAPVWNDTSNMRPCAAWQSTMLNDAASVVADMQQSVMAAPRRDGESFGWQDLDDMGGMALHRNCRDSQHFAFPDLYVRDANHRDVVDSYGAMHESAQHQHNQHLHHRTFRLNFAPLTDEVTRHTKHLVHSSHCDNHDAPSVAIFGSYMLSPKSLVSRYCCSAASCLHMRCIIPHCKFSRRHDALVYSCSCCISTAPTARANMMRAARGSMSSKPLPGFQRG